MGRIEKTVFISYRRTDESWGLAVFQDLTQHGYDVFIDYDGIASGNFEAVILENIKARAHFLVLLTPTALERCGDPEDWMRREIEAALDSQRNIVPLMLAGFDFGIPAIAKQLTGKLAALKKYNGLPIPKGYFSSAMERLRDKFLNVRVDAVLHPASNSAQQAAKEQKDKATMVLGDALHQPSLSPEGRRKQGEVATQHRAKEERRRQKAQATGQAVAETQRAKEEAAKVFISYRRHDAKYPAQRIYDAFCRVLSRDSVFMDVDSIPPGADFVEFLEGWVEKCEILVALIGRDWASRKRLQNDNDFVRIEIRAALKRGIPVVPVLLDGTPMPKQERLPDDLKKFVRRQAEYVDFRTFNADVKRLIKRLARIGEVAKAQNAEDAPIQRRREEQLVAEERNPAIIPGSQGPTAN
jgi:hypothetical protein